MVVAQGLKFAFELHWITKVQDLNNPESPPSRESRKMFPEPKREAGDCRRVQLNASQPARFDSCQNVRQRRAQEHPKNFNPMRQFSRNRSHLKSRNLPRTRRKHKPERTRPCINGLKCIVKIGRSTDLYPHGTPKHPARSRAVKFFALLKIERHPEEAECGFGQLVRATRLVLFQGPAGA